MTYSDPQFWVALLEIIGVNVVLSGDNAVVIALAARALPDKQRRQAVLWGSGAAVAMRIALTIVAVELLRLPYLKLIGAALLLWIGVQLLLPEDESESTGQAATTGMFAAIRTILIADLVMSIDNVIGVAAAAKGSLTLLVVGLLISIPLVIFGSTLLMKVMERWPIIITIGGALLGWVAGEMAVTDPSIAAWVDAHAAWLHYAGPIAGAAIVVAVGKWLAVRKSSEASGPHDETEGTADAGASAAGTPSNKSRLVLAVDGSDVSVAAVERFIAQLPFPRDTIEIDVVNVRAPVSRDVSSFVDEAQIREHHQEQGRIALQQVRARLDRAGLPYVTHIGVGDPDAVIAQYAKNRSARQIYLTGTDRHDADSLDALAASVRALGAAPVTILK